ncbi:TolC family protein [Flavobacterium psychrotolerans]|uniref:Transporter n=1 Tax=Flavobacterium psychrotolerans TaxID=2169410 RepID=A0A2U1JP71_9FLAO|nr:TolC family protein [Flavobacterium psychrotolerans]PWA06970.1 transporter [Flavobacterium psychrotolerans]
MKRIILITFLTFAIVANAQEIKSLTLKEAITYSLENKAEAKKARLKVENSEYQIQEVRSRALPQISANGSLTYNPVIQSTFLDAGAFGGEKGTIIQAKFGQPWSATAGVSLTQNLFDQSVFTGLKAARSTREFYQINEQLTEEQVIERVASAYYQVYVQRQKLTVIDTTFKNTSKIKNIVKSQYENGLAKKIDLDRISVKLSNISTQRQQISNAVQLQENALKFYMGMPIETKINIPQAVFEVTPQALSEAPNTTNRTEYLLLKKNEQLLEFQKKSIVAGYYPTLSLNGNYNFIGQGQKMPLGALPSDGVYWTNFSSVGLNLRVPLFTGFGTRAKIRQADIELKKIKEDLSDTKLALDLAYENSKLQIDNSLVTIKTQKENAQLAQEVLDNTKNNYYQGLASLTDLLDAENALTEAQNNYTSAILDYKLAEIQLIKSKGELKNLVN